MVSLSIVIISSFLYIALLFLVGYYAHRKKELGQSVVGNSHIYSLSIAVYATTWTFYGSVGKAATTGVDFLLIYLGPSLMAFSWWYLLRKTVRITKENNITSIADFISLRYGKSQSLGAIITLISVLGIMPYIALQLKAVSTSFALITARPDAHLFLSGGHSFHFINPGFYSALILSIFSIIFGARTLISSERHEGLVAALAVESIVKLVAFFSVGIFCTFFIFDGFGDIFSRMRQIHPDLLDHLTTLDGVGEVSYTSIFTMLYLSMCAIMFLPRQFHVMVIENSSEEHIKDAMWRFPAYLFLINIFVMPLAMAGILTQGSAQGADYFVLTLPIRHQQPWLALVVFLGGFSAAAGMVMVESIAIATMLLNHLVMPIVVRFKPRNWFPSLLINLKRASIILVVFLGYIYEQLIGESFTLVNMGLISFAAAAQFGPSMIGGLYWRRGNKTGAITGILLGFLIWFYTLLFPSFIKASWLQSDILSKGPFGISLLKPTDLFGLTDFDIWSHSLFWSMFFNIAGYLICSILFQQGDKEKELARKFVDVFLPPDREQRWEKKRLSKPITILQFVNLLAKFVGQQQAYTAISEYIGDREIDEKGGVSEFELPNLKRFIEKTLAGSVGSAAAGAIIESYLSDVGSRMESFYDIFSNVRTSLAESREALYVRLKASEIINRNLDIQIIMDDLLDLLRQEFKFELIIIRLCDKGENLVIRSQKGLVSDSLIEQVMQPEITTYIGDAFLSNKPQFINDTRNITKQKSREIMEREGIKSFAHIPIARTGEPPVGILSVFSRSILGIFTEPFLQLLSSLSGQLAQAVQIVNERDAKEREREQKEKAQLEHARFMREMELAKQIQLSLLPHSPPHFSDLQFACRCIPALHVGGDYYDFFHPSKQTVEMVIADVSGHNVGAALIMVETRSVLRAHASNKRTTSQALTLLNRLLYDDLTKAELFISMFLASFDARSRILSYSSAGHNKPILYKYRDQSCLELDAEGLIIGVQREVSFEIRSTELEKGDILVLYTDGITEAQNLAGDFFGEKRLKDLLMENHKGDPDTIAESILSAIRLFSENNNFQDDVSMIIMKVFM